MINEKLAEDISALGINKDDTILMHSSLSSLGHVDGGAQTVVDTLLNVLNEGTLLIPALSFGTVTRDKPCFSANETPSCVGAISEYARTRSDAVRSIHPTHSVCAIGKNAAELTAKHMLDETPVGSNSPFALLPKCNGKVLMLGCGLRPNTSMHGVEELVTPPYLFAEKSICYSLTDTEGKATEKNYRVHNFKNVSQRYDRLAEVMEIKCGNVLGATAYLIDAKAMWEAAYKKLCEDNMYFVDVNLS